MSFGELLQSYPQAGMVLMRYGLHCIGCHIAVMETIEQGARAHGLTDDEIDGMIEEINKEIASQ
ncbi:MAG: DUF1858 domain-containing protein [Candidatus Methylarchaceae archaeon HK02M1]|nr:DUF1858 domain-containing protein [Candidatus Methylarchaceae archaeon HK01M]MCP8311322.1 DUF1858 domain-containing protein [Candidatus Methylarchaceae archaeon HK02M1]